MNLCLVSIHIQRSNKAVALGNAMLASSLKRRFGNQIRVDLLDLYLDDPAGDCVDRILQLQPEWVGLSLAVWNRGMGLEIAEKLKTLRPELVILAGGPEATADRRQLSGLPCIDLVFAGEGEDLLAEAVARFLDGAAIPSLQEDQPPASIKDLSLLPSPWLDGTLKPAELDGLVWELSRGCPFKCDFCFESLGTEGIRRFPRERLQNELALFAASGVRQIFVLDPTFNYQQDEAKQILRLMTETAPGIQFNIEIRSEFIDREMAEMFAGLNCSLQIGLQSADPAVLARINRTFNPKDFQRKMLLLHEAGATYGFDLIYGLPGDSLSGFLASLDFALSMAPNHLDIFPLSVLPSTRLAETASGFGLVYKRQPPYRVLSTPTFGAEDLARAAGIAEACTLFYSRGAAVPWFGLLLENLAWSPGVFFSRLSDWLQAKQVDRTGVLRLQQDFLRDLFEELEHPDRGRIAVDIATWFGCQASLADPSLPCESEEPKAGYNCLNPLARFARFRTDPGELRNHLHGGISDFEELAFFMEEDPCEAVLYLHEGEVDCFRLTEEQARFLKTLPKKMEETSPSEELADFLLEAETRGIVRTGE
ncbi:MAG: DUF4080 domain-containing protein [Syntrophotaleaceae bacterium]